MKTYAYTFVAIVERGDVVSGEYIDGTIDEIKQIINSIKRTTACKIVNLKLIQKVCFEYLYPHMNLTR